MLFTKWLQFAWLVFFFFFFNLPSHFFPNSTKVVPQAPLYCIFMSNSVANSPSHSVKRRGDPSPFLLLFFFSLTPQLRVTLFLMAALSLPLSPSPHLAWQSHGGAGMGWVLLLALLETRATVLDVHWKSLLVLLRRPLHGKRRLSCVVVKIAHYTKSHSHYDHSAPGAKHAKPINT